MVVGWTSHIYSYWIRRDRRFFLLLIRVMEYTVTITDFYPQEDVQSDNTNTDDNSGGGRVIIFRFKKDIYKNNFRHYTYLLYGQNSWHKSFI